MTQEIPPGTESRARSLFGDLSEGRWEKARREFDAGVRHADADQIARGWTNVTQPGGGFKHRLRQAPAGGEPGLPAPRGPRGVRERHPAAPAGQDGTARPAVVAS
jgi:hypothetical protein